MASLTRLRPNILRKLISPKLNTLRLISTSKKSQDTAVVTEKCEVDDSKTVTKNKNWVSYGFDYKNQEEDENVTHATFFFSVTCCLIIGGFVWAYMPDMQMRDWAQRQAYLEIRRREKLGLPHVDPNLVDPSTIQLPSDEELGDTEIII
ncbi:NADH dehydrogenase [ubiquinone] 1 beta subcomplex subunit 11, mitochondrial [Chrysoperla carnea]|uniref:NADH dehydrogenase [ubiquinone] 1 beta subcomplex subunit 11, mitochondrial n=1 Tax=Chrysoperla carnea TaxID=189513 RepID=UPI001D0623E7|nr:NADH dehydrogenase [ubiquinone] 1 beta subcomplex subunit 11, mitochondrial [Chrysoperla carnea]